MPLRVQCPACRKSYVLPDTQLGKQVRCSQCRQAFQIGTAAPSAAAPARPPARPAASPRPDKKPVRPGGAAQTAPRKPDQAPKPRPPARTVGAAGSAGQPDYRRLFYAGVLAVLLSGVGARADSGLPAETLKAVKAGTVLLRVTLPDSAVAEGSGFFAVEPNLVLTNAHVLGMLRPEGRPPQRIEVTIHSGQEDEKTLPGQLLGVDRSTDLAVLRVTGKDLPEPLHVVSAKDLTETQTVYVFGFPFGKELGKEITISTSSVSSLRHDANHILHKVQVNGGMNPGNSGGPVVDAQGRVVGVAVSGIRQTQINFAVPGDYVHVILNGRVTGLEVVNPYRDGDAVKAPVTVRLLDPLERVQKVSLQVWMGDPGQSRHAATTEPKPLPGDSPAATVALDYARGAARGEVTLPPLHAGKVYWLRPVYVNAAGQTHWVAGVVHQAKTPVEREPVLLKYRQPADERTRVNLTSTATFQVRDFEGEMRRLAVDLGAELEEQGEHRTDTEGNLTLTVNYRKFNWQVKLDDQPILPGDRVQRVSRQMTLQTAQLGVDPEGNIHLQPHRGGFRSEVGELNEQVIQSLQAIAVPLPGKTVTPGSPWKASRTLLVSTLGSPEPGLADVTYTYLGIRKVADRSEALISLEGTIRSPKGQGLAMGGRMTGDADVDVATGRVNSAQILIDVDMDVREGRRTSKLSGTLQVHLQRTLLKAAEANVAPAPGAGTPPVRSQAPEAGSPRRPEPMPPDGDRQVVMLPGAVSDVVSGAGGRILFLTCASERQLAVFDVAAKKVVRTLPLPADDVKVAAGIDKLFMAVPGARRVDRYDLTTLTREASAELSSTPQALCMGSASRGPLLAVLARKPGVIDQESQPWFLDAATLAPLPLQADKRLSDVKPRLVRASADGHVFAWREALGGEPHSVCSVILHGTEATVHTTSTSSGLVCPAADGRYIYGGWGVYTAELDPVFPRPIPQSFGRPFIPAEQGPYFVKLDWKDWEKLGGTMEFFREGEEEPFAKSGPIEGVTSEQIYYGDLHNKLAHDQRVRVFPDANLIVTIPGSNDRLILYHFDLKAAQKAGGR